MLIFLTPHVIDDESDLEEVYRVKVAQRQEFIRRFYGKSRQQQEDELEKLLQYSMNHIDKPSVYRGNERSVNNWEVIGSQAPVAEPIEETTNTDTGESVEETAPSTTTEPESVETPRIESSEEPQTTEDTESPEDNVDTDSQTEETP